MSMMRSSSDGTIKTFATLSIAGDQLDPAEITEILRITPTLGYSKGEKYFAGERADLITGRTGVWYLATDKVIDSPKFHDHLMALFAVLALDHFEEWLRELSRSQPPSRVRTTHALRPMGRLAKLSGVINRKSLKATLTCFWHGAAGAKPPSIPRAVSAILRNVPVAIETDFATEDGSEPHAVELRA